jgi:periplasmic divalent cation tolerance protein
MRASDVRVVLMTHPARGAARFARELVALRLAACVNRAPIRSVYRWRGRIEAAGEALLVVKSSRSRLRALERHVERVHPYETPEFVVLQPRQVGARALAWLAQELP